MLCDPLSVLPSGSISAGEGEAMGGLLLEVGSAEASGGDFYEPGLLLVVPNKEQATPLVLNLNSVFR